MRTRMYSRFIPDAYPDAVITVYVAGILRTPRLRVRRHLAGGQPPLRGARGPGFVSLFHAAADDGGLLRGEPSGLQRLMLIHIISVSSYTHSNA